MDQLLLRNRRIIGVIGEGDATEANFAHAREVGSLVAERQGIVICGGLDGVMLAAAKGAKEAGGITIGILPVYNRELANEYIDIIIPTGLGHARNVIIAASSHALIAIGGSYGTLSEIALARKLEKPVMTISSFELRRDGSICGDILVEDTPRRAVSRIWKILETSH